ncbi:RidA family protein [Galbibacter sp. EGI 63066]|uniref:RidA family protein n=1 Tax=Galbibacter sp. EGI 63066 TaxID=2993559 RepID=UPI002248BE89|nr:RidA family protein [Galbibacter sp. EGI 63066]MCX2680067.1 RidA family protein [Galbibacter sp. EGI 63066]
MKNSKRKNIDFNNFHSNKIVALFCFFVILFINNGCKTDTDLKNQEVKTEYNKTSIVKEKWHWGNEKKQNENAGYAQVVKVGSTIYISGVPTNDLSPNGIAEVYKALEECLNAFGASSENVVKETLYTTDIETMKKHNDVRKEFYQGDFPAASWVQVSRLYESNAKLEVDLIAQITNGD